MGLSEDELARKRVEEEMKKLQLETEQKRKKGMRALIGGDAQDVGARKTNINTSVQKWSEKGATHHDEQHASPASAIGADVQISSVKQAYADNLEKAAHKGKVGHTNEDDKNIPEAHHLSEEKKKKFDKPSKLPSLFGGGGKKTSPPPPSKQTEEEDSFKSEFATIETEEVTMVGKEKHIKITGVDHRGRKMTKTKIILPKVTAGGSQKQPQGKSTSNPNNKLEPKDWDGTYHSLEDIRQRRVEGIDKHNREQYLSPDDFQKAFGMNKEEFSKIPKWKRDKLKTALHLF